METKQPPRKENDSDKIRNHLSVFLSFNELTTEDFENEKFIVCIYNTMKLSYSGLLGYSNLFKKQNKIKNIKKLADSIELFKDYFDGSKTKEEVLNNKGGLCLLDNIDQILKSL